MTATQPGTKASSYRGPLTNRLAFDGTITSEHYIAVTAYRSTGRPFHASPHIVASGFDSIEDAIRYAQRLGCSADYLDLEVHVLARGWGYPDMLSRVWDHRGLAPSGWTALAAAKGGAQ